MCPALTYSFHQCPGVIPANRLKLNADKTELLWVGTKYCLSLCALAGFPVYHSVQILFLQVSLFVCWE